jgi:hypothetical protein
MRDFDTSDRFSANIGEMMERLGIEYGEDVESCFGRTFGSIVRSCRVCRSAELCSNWLARAPVAVSRAPAFCPYAARLDGLALDQAVLPPRHHTVH